MAKFGSVTHWIKSLKRLKSMRKNRMKLERLD